MSRPIVNLLTVELTADLLADIDAEAERHGITRAEAAAELIEYGLAQRASRRRSANVIAATPEARSARASRAAKARWARTA